MATGYYIYTLDPQNPPCGFVLGWTGTDPTQFSQQLDQFETNGPQPFDWGSYDASGPVPPIRYLGNNQLVLYATGAGGEFGANPTWSGTDYQLLQSLIVELKSQGYITWWACYPTGTQPPHPPPNNPPPPTCPPGSHWDPTLKQCVPDTPPPPPPTDPDGDDEITVLLRFVIQLLENLKPGGGQPNDACCKAVTQAIVNISLQLVTLNRTVQQLGGNSPAVNIDLTAVVNAIDRVNTTLIADEACCKVIDADLQAIATAIANQPAATADPNLKRIADELDPTAAAAKLRAIVQAMTDDGTIDAQLGQILLE